MKGILSSIFLLSLTGYAQIPDDMYVDCQNYCAFNEFENNCHGIAFKKVKNDKTEFLYTHNNNTLKACVYFETYTIPTIKKVSFNKVKTFCHCEPTSTTLPDKRTPLTKQSKEDLKALKTQIESWARCAPDPLTIPVHQGEGQYSPSDLGVCKEMREQGQNPYVVLGGCQEGTYFNQCWYYGNTNNYAGPLCLAGDENMCNDISKNQDPQTGAWYRSAYQRRFPFSETGQPLFSRDEYLGMMMYFAKTKNKDAAKKWLVFLKNNPKKYLTGTGKLFKVHNICPPFPGNRPTDISDEQWANMQPDDRCELRPNSWGELYLVYKYIGFSDKELKEIDKAIYNKMKLSKGIVKITQLISSQFVPRYSYENGLQAASIQLYRYIGVSDLQIDFTAKTIDRRSDFGSPYYHYLAEKKATEYGAYLIKKFCPTSRPDYAHPHQGGIGTAAAGYFDSAVHLFNGLQDNWQANLATGHECIGWINMYLSGK